MIDFPSEVSPKSLGKDSGGPRGVHHHVVLKSLAADMAHELLEPRHPGDGAGPEGPEFVVCELALADVAADGAGGVVGRDPAVGQRARWRSAFEGAPGILDAQGRPQDRRVQYLYVR